MNKRLLIISVSLLLGTVQAFAQDVIDSKVEVERAYEGDIIRVAKRPLDTAVNDSIFDFKLNFDYSTFYRPYNDLYELSSAVTAGPLVEGKVRHNWLYADISAAYPLSPKADVYISPRLGNRVSALLSYNHYSFWGQVPYSSAVGGAPTNSTSVTEDGIYGDRMINRIGAVLAYRWRTGEITLWGKYSSNYYSYNKALGLSHKEIRESMSEYFDMAEGALRVRSTNPDPTSFYYDATLKYNYLDQTRALGALGRLSDLGSDVAEHATSLDVSLGATIKTYHKLFLNLGGDIAQPMMRKDPGAAKGSLPTLWTITPTYQWEEGRWRVNAGLAMFASSLEPGFFVFPDVVAEFEAVSNILWLNAKVFGDFDMHSYYDIATINPWFDSFGGVEISNEMVASLGLEGLVRDRFSYSFDFGYQSFDNMLSFASYSIYQIYNPVDKRAHLFVMNAALKWQSRDFYAAVDAGYQYIPDKSAALMLPAFKLKAALEYNVRKRFFIAADILWHTSSTGMVVTDNKAGTFTLCDVPGFVDLGVKMTYAINHGVAVYLEGNNLLNSKIQYYLNYFEPGVNVSAGVCFSF